MGEGQLLYQLALLVSVIVRSVSLSQIISSMSVRCQSRYVFVRRMLCARMCMLWSKTIFIKKTSAGHGSGVVPVVPTLWGQKSKFI